MPLLLVLGCACFVSGLSIRITDPLVPAIAADLATSEANVSLLAAAYAVPYAIIQPLLGPVGDRFGKAMVINTCLFFVAASTVLAATATSIEMMFVARVVAGLAGGGIVPLAIATVGDNVPMERRQVALSQILSALIIAMLAGTVVTGLGASLIGWRAVLGVAAGVAAVIFLLSYVWLPRQAPTGSGTQQGSFFSGFAPVFANPLSYVCFAAVFVEGFVILGLLPFIATLLMARDAGGVFEAGMVLAGMAIGGLVFTQFASRVIERTGGISNLIRLGGILTGIGFVGIALQSSWQFEMAAFAILGFGFYAIHNSLQTQASELAPKNRGAAMSLHSFFFYLGQSAGPVFYAVALSYGAASGVIAAMAVLAVGLAWLLAGALRSP